METKTISLKTLGISVTAVLALEIFFRRGIIGRIGDPLPALGIVRCLEVLLLLIIAGRFENDPNALGLSRSNMVPGLLRGLLWSVCFGIAAGVLFLVLFAVGINPLKLVHTPMPSALEQILIMYLVGGVIGPVAEEIFFRGIIFGFFRRWGFYAALLISTAFFVLPHFDGRHLPLTQMVGGIVFTIAYEKEKKLMVPLTIHCLGNMAIFSLTFFS